MSDDRSEVERLRAEVRKWAFRAVQRAERAEAKLAEIRDLCASTDRGVGYRVSGKHETWDVYHEGRHDLGGEIEAILDREVEQ